MSEVTQLYETGWDRAQMRMTLKPSPTTAFTAWTLPRLCPCWNPPGRQMSGSSFKGCARQTSLTLQDNNAASETQALPQGRRCLVDGEPALWPYCLDRDPACTTEPSPSSCSFSASSPHLENRNRNSTASGTVGRT